MVNVHYTVYAQLSSWLPEMFAITIQQRKWWWVKHIQVCRISQCKDWV